MSFQPGNSSKHNNKKTIAWMVDGSITIREDFSMLLGWTGAFVGVGRAIPNSWKPILYATNPLEAVCTQETL